MDEITKQYAHDALVAAYKAYEAAYAVYASLDAIAAYDTAAALKAE